MFKVKSIIYVTYLRMVQKNIIHIYVCVYIYIYVCVCLFTLCVCPYVSTKVKRGNDKADGAECQQ